MKISLKRVFFITGMLFSVFLFLPLCAENPVPSPPEPGGSQTESVPPPAPELKVQPFRTFGTGKADSTEAAVNPPDGMAFTPDGLLIVTDALNHRLQIFDPATGKHLGHIGDASIIKGEIVNVISLPDGSLLASDEKNNQAYRFIRQEAPRASYKLSGPPLFASDGFQKLNGLAYDSKQSIYVVDGKAGEVRRYLPGFQKDPDWNFQKLTPGNIPVIARSEGIALDEKSGTLFVTDEWNGIIHAFDIASGKWTGKSVGRQFDALSGKVAGQSVFQLSVEGLAVMDDYLLAIDEGTEKSFGHLLIFYLRSPALYRTGLEECRSRQKENIPGGLAGWMGHYRSPDGVAVFPGDGKTGAMLAVADQGSYLIFVYLWKDILNAFHKLKNESKAQIR